MSARPELLSLLETCKREPHDDAARLVLADWLEEYGGESQRDRAAYLRLCVTSGVERGLPGRARTREHLWFTNRAYWGWGFDDAIRPGVDGLSDGSPEAVGPDSVERVAGGLKWAWVSRVSLGPNPNRLAKLLDSPLLRSVPGVSLGGDAWQAARIATLARWPGLGRLRGLELDGGEGVAALLRLPELNGLRSLIALNTGVTSEDVSALTELDELALTPGERNASLARLGRLRRLTIRGTRSVAWLESMPGLTRLDVSDTPGLTALPPLPRLRSLLLARCGLGRDRIAAFARAGRFDSLDHLDLAANPGALGVVLGAFAPRSLDLSGCGLNDDTLATLAGWPGLARCRVLTLQGNRFDGLGLRLLAESPHASGLRSLGLSGLRSRTAHGLASSPVGDRLEELRITGCRDRQAVARALLPAGLLSRLRELSLDPIDAPLASAVRERFAGLDCDPFFTEGRR